MFAVGKDHLPNLDWPTLLGTQLLDRAGERRGHFHRCLVGEHLEQSLAGPDRGARLDQPARHLGLVDAFADLGQTKLHDGPPLMRGTQRTRGYVKRRQTNGEPRAVSAPGPPYAPRLAPLPDLRPTCYDANMSFSDFDLRRAVDTFGLQEDRDSDLFAAVEPLVPSAFVRVWLDEFAPVALGINSEKARSEYIIAPVLAEARRRAIGPANVLPGITLDVDRERGLSGFCDYVIARSAEYYYLRAPLVAVVEAKREDLIGGLGQCAAAMLAIREFNVREGTDLPAVYGCVTSGSIWRFLRLAGVCLSIDRPEYYLHDIGKVLGIIVHIIGTGVKA